MSHTTTLDCNTPKGRVWIAEQHATVRACLLLFACDAVETDDRTSAAVDALFYRKGTLIAAAEVRNRSMTVATLQAHGSYLVTFMKLVKGWNLAKQLRVPFVLVVGLSDAIVHWKISDDRGRWLASFRVARTWTQATANGGKMLRANAYLDLDVMKVHQRPKQAGLPLP